MINLLKIVLQDNKINNSRKIHFKTNLNQFNKIIILFNNNNKNCKIKIKFLIQILHLKFLKTLLKELHLNNLIIYRFHK